MEQFRVSDARVYRGGRVAERENYIITKKISRAPHFPASGNFVIAILGMADTELQWRSNDIKLLINAVRANKAQAVTLVLYNDEIKTSRVFTHPSPTFGDITIIALNAPSFAESFHRHRFESGPYLKDAMEASYMLSPENGRQVDYALSDYGQPVWGFDQTVLTTVAPYMKHNGRLFLHRPPVDPFSYDDGASFTIRKTKESNPLPHGIRDQAVINRPPEIINRNKVAKVVEMHTAKNLSAMTKRTPPATKPRSGGSARM
jgi:hypothetical protein